MTDAFYREQGYASAHAHQFNHDHILDVIREAGFDPSLVESVLFKPDIATVTLYEVKDGQRVLNEAGTGVLTYELKVLVV